MEIYSAVRETGLSEGDELACEQQVVGSDPRGGGGLVSGLGELLH